MIVALLNIYLFFGLIALAAVSFRRFVLSHSGNRSLYGAICILASASAVSAAITVFAGGSAILPMAGALALLFPAWLVLRHVVRERRTYRYYEASFAA